MKTETPMDKGLLSLVIYKFLDQSLYHRPRNEEKESLKTITLLDSLSDSFFYLFSVFGSIFKVATCPVVSSA